MSEELNWREQLALYQVMSEKIAEFQQRGYEKVSEKDLWHYLNHYLWRHGKPKTLFAKKEAIRAITINDYFDYERIRAQMKPDKSLVWDDLQDLL